MRKILYIALVVCLLSLTAASQANTCTTELSDKNIGSHISVEACENIGVFSLGGLYEGQWEKLTYSYPKPWPGTYVTVSVDGKYYASSNHPRDATALDAYLTERPEKEGDSITVKWTLPENIVVEEKLTVVENGTELEILAQNQDAIPHKIAVRIHLDTMLGLNDGAPIYIPGDGLKTTEKEYAEAELNFRYWKAYNRQDSPTIVATGYLNPEEGLTYPVKVSLADWKKSKDNAWDYQVSQDRSILGDSAILLYYNTMEVLPTGTYEVKTKYGSGQPVLPKEKGEFGITEVTQDNIYGKYCPTQTVNISVDVVSSASTNSGVAVLTVYDKEKQVFTQSKPTGTVPADSYKKITYQFTIPESDEEKTYDVLVTLTDAKGAQLDKATRTSFINVKPQDCKPRPKSNIGLIIVIMLFIIFLAALVFAVAYVVKRMGKVVITKTVDDKGNVKVTVENNTHEDLKDCVVEDRIPSQAEIKVSTLSVARRDNKLVWDLGKLKSKDKAKMEYKIKGVNVLPPARVIWDGGEEISD
ncbi:MAG: hypothetical protein ABH834_02370 [Candidatus Altiarchaeota archaeon]